MANRRMQLWTADVMSVTTWRRFVYVASVMH